MKLTLFVDQKGVQWHTIPTQFRKKTNVKNQRYPQKLMFTAIEGPTDVPLVVLGYSVGVVRQ